MFESQKDLTRTRTSLKELREKIVRAASWKDIFSSEEEEMANFKKTLIDTTIAEYEANHTLRRYRVEHPPEGDLHVFERTTTDCRTTYQKLKSGDVVIIFYNPVDPHRRIITPDIGNIAHNFTVANTVLPAEGFLEGFKFKEKELIEICGTHITALLKYIPGKPATRGWEEVFLLEGEMPQRIGYRIYQSFILEAQSRLMQAYPKQFK